MRSEPVYRSTSLPSAKKTKDGTSDTFKVLANALDSLFLSTINLAHLVAPAVFLERETTAGKIFKHPLGGSFSTETSTIASCLAHSISTGAMKPGTSCAGMHNSKKSFKSASVEMSVKKS